MWLEAELSCSFDLTPPNDGHSSQRVGNFSHAGLGSFNERCHEILSRRGNHLLEFPGLQEILKLLDGSYYARIAENLREVATLGLDIIPHRLDKS